MTTYSNACCSAIVDLADARQIIGGYSQVERTTTQLEQYHTTFKFSTLDEIYEEAEA